MKKINFHGDSKVINYIVDCINWFIDNHSVSTLDDVILTDIADGQILKYDSTTSKFVNADESGGGGSVTPSITKVYDSNTSGSSSYTVLKDGLYLIINSYSYYATHSVTLSRTPIISGYIGSDRGMTWDIVNLKKNDVVIMVNTPSSWDAFGKIIYLLENITVDSLSDSEGVDDGTATLTPPSGNYLMVGIAMGRTSNDYSNNTDTTGFNGIKLEDEIGVNTSIGVYYGDDIPEGNFYGYDGGGGYIALFLARNNGGGSGTNVVANPTGTPIDTLTTIGIDGTRTTYYTENSQICSVNGNYVTSNLDTQLVNGGYKIHITDGAYEFDNNFTYSGSTVILELSANGETYIIEITSTTVGMTYCNGAWRNIYCDIYSESSGQTIYDLGTSADKVSYDNTTSGLTADDVQEAIDELADEKVDKVAGKGLSTNDFTDTLNDKLDGIEAGAEVNAVDSVNGQTGTVVLDKTDIGLGNVDNTSDADKPISTATQTALNAKANTVDLGTASAKNFTTSVTQGSTDLITSGAVYNEFANLPKPEIFKGTLGTNGTITSLPTASSDNEGWEYKVITAGTYAGQPAKYGDTFISDGTQWVYIPSGDETDTDTWRGINVNGSQLLGNGISSGNVNFKSGTNAQVSGSGNDVTVDIDTTFTDASSRVNIASGDSIKTILGKIKKWFDDSVTGVKGNHESTYRTGNVNLTSDNVEAIRKLFDLNPALGNSSLANNVKTYFINNINNNSVEIGYNNLGEEYGLIFSRGGSNAYGSVLRYTYAKKYLEILRRHPNGSYDGWFSEDWERIDAGYADKAGADADGNNIASTYLKKTGGDVTGLLRIIGGASNKRFMSRNIIGSDSSDNPSEAELYIQYGNNVSDNVFFGATAGGLIRNNGTEYTGSSLKLQYYEILNTADKLDAFSEIDRFKMALFGNWSAEDKAKASYPGITNGIILSGGYASDSYGFQIAIDDDPGYFIALRQKGGNNGWSAWKRIPMADGTGANSTWGISISGSANYATTAGSAPASDVSAWAKASTKPSYTFDEIGSGYAKIGDGANYILWRLANTWHSGVYYQTYGDEATVFGNQNTRASWIFANTDPEARTQWNQLTNVAMHIKNGKVAIGKLIPNSQYLTDTLEVNGTVGISTSGSIASGNTQAVTGGAVYDYHNTTPLNPKTGLYVRKSGNVVTIDASITVDSNTVIYTLPSGYRPLSEINANCIVNIYESGTNKYYPGYVVIGTNGEVFVVYLSSVPGVLGYAPSGAQVKFNATWII